MTSAGDRGILIALAICTAIAAMSFSASTAHADTLAAPAGGAMLTVVGGRASNRGALDSDHDVLLISLEVEDFTRAASFDRAMLAAMPATTATVMLPRIGNVSGRGPRLDAVMAAAGVADADTLMLVGIDGYRAVLPPDMRADGTWVLATATSDGPLNLGGRGPLWLLRDGGAPDSPTRRRMVWGVIAIVVVPAGTTMPPEE